MQRYKFRMRDHPMEGGTQDQLVMTLDLPIASEGVPANLTVELGEETFVQLVCMVLELERKRRLEREREQQRLQHDQ